MLGLCEERMEVHQVMDDMRSADIDFMTMGQYLQLTPKHAKVIDFVTPQAFDAYAQIARAKGFLQVASSPLTRSSYNAVDDCERMRAPRAAQLARVQERPCRVRTPRQPHLIAPTRTSRSDDRRVGKSRTSKCSYKS